MQTAFTATCFDGHSSRAHDVDVEFGPGSDRLAVRGATIGQLYYTLERISIAPRVGDTARVIYLTGGANLETDDNDAVDKLVLARPGGRFQRLQHAMESKLRWVVAMLALTIFLAWATFEYGCTLSCQAGSVRASTGGGSTPR